MADITLTLEQRKLFKTALESSYASFEEIKMLVSLELGVRLGIADGTDLGLGVFKVIEWAEQNGRTRDLAEALIGSRHSNQDVSLFQKSLPVESAAELLNRAIESLGARSFDDALRSFDRVIALEPRWPEAFYNRGLTYYCKGDDGRAIQDFIKALDLGFETSLLFRNRANAYSSNKQFPEALADYERAIALEPGSPIAYLNRGSLHVEMAHKDLAAADYRKVLDLPVEEKVKQDARERLAALGL
jgi:tetratricopeptide (TPR) repeat protein